MDWSESEQDAFDRGHGSGPYHIGLATDWKSTTILSSVVYRAFKV